MMFHDAVRLLVEEAERTADVACEEGLENGTKLPHLRNAIKAVREARDGEREIDRLRAEVTRLTEERNRQQRLKEDAGLALALTESAKNAAEAAIRDVLYCAYKFDDKPHHLFSAIRKLAQTYARPEDKAEITRLMDEAYERGGAT